jgi:hypothetical protein
VAEEGAGRMPDFLYVGTSKAGSTWIYNVLATHQDVFIAPGKGTYFFDQHFERGIGWYREQFERADDGMTVGEISHSYLSSPQAAGRIADWLPEVKLIVCLREPVERAFSAYLDSVKNGRFTGSFEAALESNPSLLDRGAYAQHLDRYLSRFPRQQLHICLFDDLKSVPQRFADELCDFLALEHRQLKPSDRQKMMPAAKPRSPVVTGIVKRAARTAETIGLRNLRGRVKRSRLMRDILYRPLNSDEMPRIDPQVQDRCRQHFRPEVQLLDDRFGLSLQDRWNYR